MRISVMSPVHRSGNSIVTALMAQSVVMSQHLKVMLTYTGEQRDSASYLGVKFTPDITRSISQVYRLLEAQAISPKDIYDYAVPIQPDLYLFDTFDPTLKPENMTEITSFVFENIDADVTFCDINTEIYDAVTQQMFDLSDIVCFVINPDVVSRQQFEKWKKSEWWPKKARVMLVVNRYDEQVDALRNISRLSGMQHSDVCKLHYNPLITKYCNEGKLSTMMKYILLRDPQVIELNTDFKEMMQFIMSLYGLKLKWEV